MEGPSESTRYVYITQVSKYPASGHQLNTNKVFSKLSDAIQHAIDTAKSIKGDATMEMWSEEERGIKHGKPESNTVWIATSKEKVFDIPILAVYILVRELH